MTHEQVQPPQPTSGHEFKLVLPSLSTPYQGAYEEVYADYLADPESFETTMFFRMETENPNLLPLFDTAVGFSPNEDLTFKWMSIYYEIFARASRKTGLPPIFVSERVKDTQSNLTILRGLSVEGDQRSKERIKERRARDELSPELVLFWKGVDNDLEMELAEPDSEYTINCMVPLLVLQHFLQAQDDEYAITGAYAQK